MANPFADFGLGLGGGVAGALNGGSSAPFLGGPQNTNVIVGPSHSNIGEILKFAFDAPAAGGQDVKLSADLSKGQIGVSATGVITLLAVGAGVVWFLGR